MTAIAQLPAALSLFSLQGQTALVTGASSGLGLQGFQCLARAGARVIGAARRVDLVQSQAESLLAQGLDAHSVAMDISSDAGVAQAFSEMDRRGMIPDIVVNFAGIGHNRKWRHNQQVDWHRLLQTNLLGAERVSQAAVQRLLAHKRPGNIIQVASTLGLTVQPSVSAYASSKAALMHLTKSMAMELWPRGIRVNCLAPGLFRTPFTADFERDHGSQYFDLSVTRRMGEAPELEGALLFLASPASSYVNGIVLPVDGGNHLRGM